MKARVKRVRKMGKDRPNRELRKKGAVMFSELESSIVSSDTSMDTTGLTGSATAVKADTIGPRAARKPRREAVSPVGERVLREIEQFPPDEEPYGCGWNNTNLKLTAIGGDDMPSVTRVIASEEDLKVNLNDAIEAEGRTGD
jgi:hypothetical protein